MMAFCIKALHDRDIFHAPNYHRAMPPQANFLSFYLVITLALRDFNFTVNDVTECTR